MSERKTPILIQRGPLSGAVYAITKYTRKQVNGREVIRAQTKHEVTAYYEALVLDDLIASDAEDIVSLLDGAANGEVLNIEERGQVRRFHDRLRAMVERHNARIGAKGKRA